MEEAKSFTTKITKGHEGFSSQWYPSCAFVSLVVKVSQTDPPPAVLSRRHSSTDSAISQPRWVSIDQERQTDIVRDCRSSRNKTLLEPQMSGEIGILPENKKDSPEPPKAVLINPPG